MKGGRLLGPLGSVLVHAVLLVLLVKLLVFEGRKEEAVIAVDVMDLSNIAAEQQREAEAGEAATESVDRVVEQMMEESLAMKAALELPPVEMDRLELDLPEVPMQLPSALAGRTEVERKKRLRQHAGGYGNKIEEAVLRGLLWLQKVQNEDGSWGVGTGRSITAKQERARLTGLALMAFLAHGETFQSEQFGATVQRGIEYLITHQEPKTGRFCPIAKSEGSHDDIGVYGHAIATCALAEAYSLTKLPSLREPVLRAARVILQGQQRGGGWDHRYQKLRWSDLSVSAWQIQALKAVEMTGLELEGLDQALAAAVPFLQGMHEGEGRFYYRTGNKKPASGLDYMTGAAVFCLQLLEQQNGEAVKAGLHYLREIECTEWADGWEKTVKNKSFNIAYEWYYTTLSIFLKGGSQWTTWNRKFAPMLLAAQDESGAWKPPSEAGLELTKDIIYTTEFCTLALQVYYRLLPSQQPKLRQPFQFVDDVMVELR